MYKLTCVDLFLVLVLVVAVVAVAVLVVLVVLVLVCAVCVLPSCYAIIMFMYIKTMMMMMILILLPLGASPGASACTQNSGLTCQGRRVGTHSGRLTWTMTHRSRNMTKNQNHKPENHYQRRWCVKLFTADLLTEQRGTPLGTWPGCQVTSCTKPQVMREGNDNEKKTETSWEQDNEAQKMRRGGGGDIGQISKDARTLPPRCRQVATTWWDQITTTVRFGRRATP